MQSGYFYCPYGPAIIPELIKFGPHEKEKQMSDLKSEKLDFWIKNNYNVLFVGKHGVGKTSIIKSAFERAGLRWKYFSASTLDPWVDLVGVPKEIQTEEGNYLDLVRPKEFQYDEVDAVFFDEFNRSHKKVRNAVMELLQFKSINGKKFNNLKIVWAAVNPSDEEGEYDVEKIDPAQEDRFQIKVEVPYKPVESYFNHVYGKENSRAAITWWNELPEPEKNKISPRRLDYALDIYVKEGDLRDVLPESSNVPKLLATLKFGPISDKLSKFYKDGNTADAALFLSNENNYNSALEWILKTKERRSFFVPLLENEKIASLLQKDSVFNTIIEEARQNQGMINILENIINSNQNKTVVKKLYNKTKHDPILGQLFGGGDPTLVIPPALVGTKTIAFKPNPAATEQGLNSYLDQVAAMGNYQVYGNTYNRIKILNNVYSATPAVIGPATATKLFGLVLQMGRASQITTLVKNKLVYMGLFNHVVNLCCAADKIDWAGFCKKYLAGGQQAYKQTTANYVWKKIQQSPHLLEGLSCPKL